MPVCGGPAGTSAQSPARETFRRSGSCRLPTADCPLFGPHQRKQDDVPDGRAVGEQHDEPIDADALARGGWHAELEGADVVLVHLVRFLVAAGTAAQLLFEAPPL